MEKMPKLDKLTSADLVEQNIETLKQLFPTIVKEGKIDATELQALLGEYVETGDEYYRFTWAGKTIAKAETNKPSTATLRPDRESSKDWDNTQNLFIEGDNLEVLKLLQKSYSNKVKMIYIDPPYNTGNDFVYKDDYKDNLRNYEIFTGQRDEQGLRKHTNNESDGRYHSNWLNMMYPRLRLARNLLSEDGVIFISIDDNEQANLKKLCDEIFGEENFRGNIIRATGTTTGQDAMSIGSSYDSCLCYAKSSSFSLRGIPLEGSDLNRFNQDDNDGLGVYALLQLRKTGNADRKEDRENMFYPVQAPDETNVYPIGPSGYLSRWRVAHSTYENLCNDNLIVWKEDDSEVSKQDGLGVPKQYQSKWKPYVKYYLEDRTKQVSNLWNDIDGNKKGSIELKNLFDDKKIFDNPKPVAFIHRALQVGTDKDSIVLDFFAGSGTTAHAVMQLNAEDRGARKWISVQLPEPTDEKSEAYKAKYANIAEITKERIRRAGEKIKRTATIDKLDVGFKSFKLDSTNMIPWDSSKDALEQQLNLFTENNGDSIKSDRTEDDLLYEILLKYGIDLNMSIKNKDIKGRKIYNIGNGLLFVCLDKNITATIAEEIGKWKEQLSPKSCRVIFRDTGFASDADKTNSMQILHRFAIDEIVSI